MSDPMGNFIFCLNFSFKLLVVLNKSLSLTPTSGFKPMLELTLVNSQHIYKPSYKLRHSYE